MMRYEDKMNKSVCRKNVKELEKSDNAHKMSMRVDSVRNKYIDLM